MRTKARGQGMVEWAVTIGVILLLFLGAIDATQYLMAHATVERAAAAAVYQAALSGADGPTSGAVATAAGDTALMARTVLSSGFGTDARAATFAITCPQGCARYKPVVVSIRYQVDAWAPLGVWNDIDITRTATRPLERDRP
jgi:Flp pilus assembly protein TadG